MKQTIAHSATPSPSPKVSKTKTVADNSVNPGSVFVGMALDMTWRLAITVLVPIIGGFELDQHLKTAPAFTLTGFLLAMIGMFVVMKQTLKLANDLSVQGAKKSKKGSK